MPSSLNSNQLLLRNWEMPEVGNDTRHIGTASLLSHGLPTGGQGLLDCLKLIRASRVWSPECSCIGWSEAFDSSAVLV